ncbi:MAG TPA: ABC transporter substrate-binding protein [Thermoanaerobaculia bacterium]|jgi:branched-chain amino acid transport system substrate-binding protein|nr:ABC transporter substrate-binding protein [Thermoanaerobaculia bacterium]
MKKTWLVLSTALLSLLLIGCPPKTGETGAAAAGGEGGEIVVGEYGSMTGGQATFGVSTHNGIMLAVDEINAGGGVNGRKIRVITEDDQSKAEEAANAVTKLISQNNVVAVLGEVASSNSLAAAPICQSNKVPMITPSSTNPRVTEVGDYIFRMCFIDPYQGEAMANYLTKKVGMKKAAILIDVKSDYSTGLASFFERTFTANGGQIVGKQSYAQGDSDFRSQLTAIKAGNPDVIFVPGYYNDIGQIAIQARDLGMQQPLAGGDGWESPKLIEIGGKALEGCFYSNHYHVDDPAPAVREFVQKYEERFGAKPDSLAALGYDSTRVLADAIKRAGTTDGPKLRDAIAQTQNFSGVTGSVTLGPDRNPIGKKLVVLEIRNGNTVLKDVVDPSAGSAPAATDTSATNAGTTTSTDTSATGTAPNTGTARTQ